MASNSSLGSFRSQSLERYRVLGILVVIAAGLFILSCYEGGSGVLSAIQGGVQVVVSPVRYVGAIATMPFQGLSNAVINLTASEASLSELKEENERLLAENATLKEAQQTAERLEGLLGIQSSFNLESVGARVISQSSDSATTTITIDKGSLAGLEVNMPVTDSLGVVGQIAEVTPTTSVVRLITDERSGVAAMVQESRAHGEIRGSADGMLRLELVSTAQTVEVNDLVITSGLGGIYPKGLPIGVVTNVIHNSGDLYQTIQVEPLAQVGAFEEVLVITDVTQDQLAEAADAAEAQNQEALREGDDSEKSDAEGDGSQTDSQNSNEADGQGGEGEGASANGSANGSQDADDESLSEGGSYGATSSSEGEDMGEADANALTSEEERSSSATADEDQTLGGESGST